MPLTRDVHYVPSGLGPLMLSDVFSKSGVLHSARLCTLLPLVVWQAACVAPAPGASPTQTAADSVSQLTSIALERRHQGDLTAALNSLVEAREVALQQQDPASLAMVDNNLGLLAADRQDWGLAASHFESAAAFADEAGMPTFSKKALASAVRSHVWRGQPQAGLGLIDRAASTVSPKEDASESVLLNHLTHSALLIAERFPAFRAQALQLGHALNGLARIRTEQPKQSAIRVYSLAYSAWLNMLESDYAEADRNLTRALFLNQQHPAGESAQASWMLYVLQARSFQAQGALSSATSAYEKAIEQLDRLRPQVIRQGLDRPYLDLASPSDVYRRLLAQLFDEARSLGAGSNEQRMVLLKARDYAEQMKAAELRDFFRDDCVDNLQAKLQDVGTAAADTAVVYPVILQNRVELLLQLPGGDFRHFSVQVEQDELLQTLRAYRTGLEARTYRFAKPAAQLYAWLIQPMESSLGAEVNTLVFVPGGELLAVPLAGLLDQNGRFLIERFAVAVTPGLKLTDPQPLDRAGMRPLYGGLSQAREGFPALEAVPLEIRAASRHFPGKVLMDADFEAGKLNQSLQDDRLNILHLATHGQFGDNSQQSFILTSDGRLSLDKLSGAIGQFKYRDQPLDLLVLSACETARGSARAALGLSGIAVKAGARSAIGTLWQVDDQASAELMQRFYALLKNEPSLSRAQVLRKAQLDMQVNSGFRNPGYWSPYILINSWL